MIDKVIREQSKVSELINPNDVISNFRDKEAIIRKRIHRIFSRIKRWANITTMVSIPIAIAGLATDVSLLSVSGAGIAGISHIST